MSPASLMVALAVVIGTICIHNAEGYYYYYYYYYYSNEPKLCTASYYNPNTIKTCPISSCHCSLTYDLCCLRYFTYNNVLYKQCICNYGTTCAPTNATIDNPQPPATQSSTTTRVPTTTSTSTTPTTTSTTTTTATSTTSSTTTPTTTSTTTTPTTTSTTTTPTTTSTSTTTPTTTSTTTTPTTTSTTTTPTTTSTTTTPTTTSTTTPTTTSTTTPTTTSTTTSTTTTPAFRSLCDNGFRLLNGDSVSDCAFNGVANVTMFNGEIEVCNAVYAPATVNGVLKDTFITALACKNIIETMAKANVSLEIQIGSQKYPVTAPLFTVVEGPDGTAFIDINSRYANLLSDLGCQKGACPYNEVTMADKVDFNDCKIVSWGVIDPASLSSDGLHEAKIAVSPSGCTTIPETFGEANTLCFRTLDGANLFCARDLGSPVYCKAPSNGEWILVGVTAHQESCNVSPEVKVLPYPG